jgi:hypothetical protein
LCVQYALLIRSIRRIDPPWLPFFCLLSPFI